VILRTECESPHRDIQQSVPVTYLCYSKRHKRDDETEESELITLHYRDEDYVGKSQRMISNILTEVLQLATDAVNFPLEIEATGIQSLQDWTLWQANI
jgi:hypothetical protein